MQTKDRNGLKDIPVGEGYSYNFKQSSDRGLYLSWMCLMSQKRVEGKFTRPTVFICHLVKWINEKSIPQPGFSQTILFLLLNSNT